MSYFSPGLFRFLNELKAHNRKAWFEDNRERYERDVKVPMLSASRAGEVVWWRRSLASWPCVRSGNGSCSARRNGGPVRQSGIAVEGEALKRVPAGHDPEHPFAEDLKLKDLYTTTRFTDRQVCSPDFMSGFLAACRAASPPVAFLTRSVGLPW
ncbi:MAG: DUF2461 family protein [Armatimonadota bacterium]